MAGQEGEVDRAGLQAILAHISALEQARGSLGQGAPGASTKKATGPPAKAAARPTNRAALGKDILAQLVVLELEGTTSRAGVALGCSTEQEGALEDHDSQGDRGEVVIAVAPSEQDQDGKQMHHTKAGHSGLGGQMAASIPLEPPAWQNSWKAGGWPWGAWSQASPQGQLPCVHTSHTGGRGVVIARDTAGQVKPEMVAPGEQPCGVPQGWGSPQGWSWQ